MSNGFTGNISYYVKYLYYQWRSDKAGIKAEEIGGKIEQLTTEQNGSANELQKKKLQIEINKATAEQQSALYKQADWKYDAITLVKMRGTPSNLKTDYLKVANAREDLRLALKESERELATRKTALLEMNDKSVDQKKQQEDRIQRQERRNDSLKTDHKAFQELTRNKENFKTKIVSDILSSEGTKTELALTRAVKNLKTAQNNRNSIQERLDNLEQRLNPTSKWQKFKKEVRDTSFGVLASEKEKNNINRKISDLKDDHTISNNLIEKAPKTAKGMADLKTQVAQFNAGREYRDNQRKRLNKLEQQIPPQGNKIADTKNDYKAAQEMVSRAGNNPKLLPKLKEDLAKFETARIIRNTLHTRESRNEEKLKRAEAKGSSIEINYYTEKTKDTHNDYEASRALLQNAQKTTEGITALNKNLETLKDLQKERDTIHTDLRTTQRQLVELENPGRITRTLYNEKEIEQQKEALARKENDLQKDYQRAREILSNAHEKPENIVDAKKELTALNKTRDERDIRSTALDKAEKKLLKAETKLGAINEADKTKDPEKYATLEKERNKLRDIKDSALQQYDIKSATLDKRFGEGTPPVVPPKAPPMGETTLPTPTVEIEAAAKPSGTPVLEVSAKPAAKAAASEPAPSTPPPAAPTPAASTSGESGNKEISASTVVSAVTSAVATGVSKGISAVVDTVTKKENKSEADKPKESTPTTEKGSETQEPETPGKKGGPEHSDTSEFLQKVFAGVGQNLTSDENADPEKKEEGKKKNDNIPKEEPASFEKEKAEATTKATTALVTKATASKTPSETPKPSGPSTPTPQSSDASKSPMETEVHTAAAVAQDAIKQAAEGGHIPKPVAEIASSAVKTAESIATKAVGVAEELGMAPPAQGDSTKGIETGVETKPKEAKEAPSGEAPSGPTSPPKPSPPTPQSSDASKSPMEAEVHTAAAVAQDSIKQAAEGGHIPKPVAEIASSAVKTAESIATKLVGVAEELGMAPPAQGDSTKGIEAGVETKPKEAKEAPSGGAPSGPTSLPKPSSAPRPSPSDAKQKSPAENEIEGVGGLAKETIEVGRKKGVISDTVADLGTSLVDTGMSIAKGVTKVAETFNLLPSAEQANAPGIGAVSKESPAPLPVPERQEPDTKAKQGVKDAAKQGRISEEMATEATRIIESAQSGEVRDFKKDLTSLSQKFERNQTPGPKGTGSGKQVTTQFDTQTENTKRLKNLTPTKEPEPTPDITASKEADETQRQDTSMKPKPPGH